MTYQKAVNLPDSPTKRRAMFIAMFIRNEMENFHADHLSDAQMAELNPLIRNAVFTALHAWEHVGDVEGIVAATEHFGSFAMLDWPEPHGRTVGYHLGMVPDYWEEPVFTQSGNSIGCLESCDPED